MKNNQVMQPILIYIGTIEMHENVWNGKEIKMQILNEIPTCCMRRYHGFHLKDKFNSKFGILTFSNNSKSFHVNVFKLHREKCGNPFNV